MKTVRTEKGTELPLTNLKGKSYLMVAYRIQWMNEKETNFDIQTEILKAEKDESIVKATVCVFDKEGKLIKRTTATKREDSKGFPDHLEKAETGSIGRALALMGYGTQFALSDLDEGERLADSPLPEVAKTEAPVASEPSNVTELPKKSSSFKKPGRPPVVKKAEDTTTTQTAVNDGWE